MAGFAIPIYAPLQCRIFPYVSDNQDRAKGWKTASHTYVYRTPSVEIPFMSIEKARLTVMVDTFNH